jgi:hypothetical protein
MKRITLLKTISTLGICSVLALGGVVSLNSCGKSGSAIDVSKLDISSDGQTLNGFIIGYAPPKNSKLIVPGTVKSVGPYAFENQRNITELDLGNVQSINNDAFSGCTGLTTLVIPNTCAAIEAAAFKDCTELTGTLTIPSGIVAISPFAFSECSGFSYVVIPDTVTSIGQSAFRGCIGLKGTLTLPNDLTTIDRDAFKGDAGFNGSLTFPDALTTIGDNAFKACSGFTEISLPNNLVTTGVQAFGYCANLVSIRGRYQTLPSSFDAHTFAGVATVGSVSNNGSVEPDALLQFLVTSCDLPVS